VGEVRTKPRPGGETIITRLADIFVTQAIRSWLAEDPLAQTGWLGALKISRLVTLKRFIGISPGAARQNGRMVISIGNPGGSVTAQTNHLKSN